MNSNKDIALSVIIVNYNVAYFLEQCLLSVFNSKGIERCEVFVIDNRSSDGSVAMVEEKFPQVHLIINEENVGFSKANNQGILLAKGKYIVLLNPDTVVEEQTFEKTIAAFEANEHVGGIGVRMVDGKGIFLPESKRGLPTPLVAFYKVFGISRLFPNSKKFGRYHLTYLNEHDTNEVDVLSGAYMGLRHDVLKKIGLLDEAFFMYGEDIDLSYRIQKAGYKNLYVADTTIIHYKGESTKKSSVNYVFVFYRAMIIFARKHFSQNYAFLFSLFIHLGIYIRASLAVSKRIVNHVFPMLWNVGVGILGLYGFTSLWKSNEIDFPAVVYYAMIPSYWIIWSLANLMAGTYDPPFKPMRLLKGTAVGTIFILIAYALLPKDLQFSRLFILGGALWFLCWNIIDRLIRYLIFKQSSGWNPSRKKRFLIIGEESEFKRIKLLLLQHMNEVAYVHGTYINEAYPEARYSVKEFEHRTNLNLYDELIFSAKDLSAYQIIQWMTSIKLPHLDFKIAQPDADFIIGSNSIDTSGETYRININKLSRPETLRSKRFFDLTFSGLLLTSLPVSIWFFQNKNGLIENICKVLIGRLTWVGFIDTTDGYKDPQLPALTPGVLTPTLKNAGNDRGLLDKLNILYARDYSVFTDVQIVITSFRKLDQQS
ncbi:MAG: glycosyltransferase family 2 protein [Flavobacteriales bacterium]